jgi:hypothetical protein
LRPAALAFVNLARDPGGGPVPTPPDRALGRLFRFSNAAVSDQHFWPFDRRHCPEPGCVLRSAAGWACALSLEKNTGAKVVAVKANSEATIKARIMRLPLG